MKMTREKVNMDKKTTRSLSGSILALVAVGFVTGCSQVPDAVNPMQWYNNSVEFFAGEDSAEAEVQNTGDTGQSAAASSNGSDAEFPLLSGVEQQQQRVVARERAKGLVADVEGRKYAPAIARQGEPVTAPPPPPPAVTAEAPAPTPVTTAAAAPASAAAPATQTASAAGTVAAAQPAASQPRQLPVTGNAQHDDFQARFAKRLAEIRTQASLGTTMPVSAIAPTTYDTNVDTVVVSSTGIEAGYGTPAPALAEGIPTINSQSTYVEQGMPAIGPGAVKVATIRFENGSSKLSSRDRQILANVMKLKKERGGTIRVVGHASSRTRNTDPVMHKMINFRVSAARADAIAQELMRMGADRAQLQINAISDSAPQYLEIMPTGEAGNRRAEIYLES